jgi:activator of the mannose operon (transcriptional antiterminator)
VELHVGSKERKWFILKRLLEQEHLSYQQLSNEYFVSRSSIANDLSFIKSLFLKEGLALSFDNSGTYFEGGEIQIQKMLKRIILKKADHPICKELFIEPISFAEISKALYEGMGKKGIEIPESYVQNIIVSLYVMIQRAEKGYHVQLETSSRFDNLLLEFNNYPLVYELLKHLENQGIYQFSTEEIQYLTYLIIGSGLKFFMKDQRIPLSFRGKVRALIQKVSEGLQIDLTHDHRLEEDLLIHLYQLMLRVSAQSSVVNPLIQEIKQTYPVLYGVIWFSLTDFCRPYQMELSDDEIGFVAIHFQAAIERTRRKEKILFVCPNGIGTSSFVAAKIRRILPDIDTIETASLAKLARMDLKEVDFIISTVAIPNLKIPVVQITPMATGNDMKRIMEHYIDLVIERENHPKQMTIPKQTQELLRETILFSDFSSKEAVLSHLIENQFFTDETKKKHFTQSVLEREALQSTYLENGFALPHGDPQFAEQTKVTILILDKPVLWGKQKADIIVFLMIREEEIQHVEPIMELVMQGIKEKEWFISKMMEVKK